MNAYWVLIVFGINGNGSLTTVPNFYSEQACVVAKKQVEEFRNPMNLRYGAICVKSN